MIIGTCSCCGGAVELPDVWGGIIPPAPTCTQCGARGAHQGPIIKMTPVDQIRFWKPYTTTNTTEPK